MKDFYCNLMACWRSFRSNGLFNSSNNKFISYILLFILLLGGIYSCQLLYFYDFVWPQWMLAVSNSILPNDYINTEGHIRTQTPIVIFLLVISLVLVYVFLTGEKGVNAKRIFCQLSYFVISGITIFIFGLVATGIILRSMQAPPTDKELINIYLNNKDIFISLVRKICNDNINIIKIDSANQDIEESNKQSYFRIFEKLGVAAAIAYKSNNDQCDVDITAWKGCYLKSFVYISGIDPYCSKKKMSRF